MINPTLKNVLKKTFIFIFWFNVSCLRLLQAKTYRQ